MSNQTTTGEIIIWCLVLMAALAACGVAFWLVRRWTLSSPQLSHEPEWTLQQLRELRAAKKITAEEFERLRAGLLNTFSTATESAEPADDQA